MCVCGGGGGGNGGVRGDGEGGLLIKILVHLRVVVVVA